MKRVTFDGRHSDKALDAGFGRGSRHGGGSSTGKGGGNGYDGRDIKTYKVLIMKVIKFDTEFDMVPNNKHCTGEGSGDRFGGNKNGKAGYSTPNFPQRLDPALKDYEVKNEHSSVRKLTKIKRPS